MTLFLVQKYMRNLQWTMDIAASFYMIHEALTPRCTIV